MGKEGEEKDMDEIGRLKQYQSQGLQDCPLCVNWFLGCLNGRNKWADKSVKPGFCYTGQSSKEYISCADIPPTEYPLRMHCKAFIWDPNSERLGRVVF
jgi:hypothetical protein